MPERYTVRAITDRVETGIFSESYITRIISAVTMPK